jgi:preprotein translocase subunit Sss1
MARDRSRIGWLVSALGAIVLIVAVFLPWYGVGLTARAIAYMQQLQSEQVQKFGNAALQGELGSLHARVGSLAGQQLGSISAHQAFSRISVVLWVVGGLGVLIALLPLVRESSPESDGTGPWLALLGAVAAVCVLYRMGVRPTENAYLTLPLRAGAWLALLGSVAMIAGGLWPRRLRAERASDGALQDAWSGLSGWTPEG